MQEKIISIAVRCNWTEEEIRGVCEKNNVSFEEVINKINELRLINENIKKNTSKNHEECSDLVIAKTHGAAQRNWQTPSEFPCCPQESTDTPIASYAEKLKIGSIFASNDIYQSIVLKFATDATMKTLYVMSESDNMKPWAVAKITYEDKLYIHESLGSFFFQEGAEKEFCIAQGLEWTGEDPIDDYC